MTDTTLTLADATYRRDLGDGLLLRWSTAADAERLATFYGQVFRRSEDGPPSERAPLWSRELVSGRHPLIGQDGFALVEQTATGEVVAATCLLRQAWEYDGIRFPVGRPEIVGSLPDYRRRGLVREIFRLIHARSEAEGHLAQVITGIPWYYRQFGYEYTLDLDRTVRVAFADLPAAKDGEAEPVTLRRAGEADLETVARLYDEERAPALVSTPIDADFWRWSALEAIPLADGFTQTYVIEDASGAIVGYALAPARAWDGQFTIYALWLRRGLWLSALPAVLRACRTLALEARISITDQPPHAFTLDLYQSHPALQTLPAFLTPHTQQEPYAWYVRVADLPALLRTLAPALERRLAASPFAGYSGELTLDFYRGGLRMVWDAGRLAEVADWQKPVWGKPSAGFPPGIFLQLLFGYRDLPELRHNFPDVWADGVAKALLPTLFPRGESWVAPLG